MKKTTCLLGLVLLLGLAFPRFAEVHTRNSVLKADDDFTITKVTDGVYAAVAKAGGIASGNAGFVVGDDGVLIVDTFFTPTAIEELIETIGTETNSQSSTRLTPITTSITLVVIRFSRHGLFQSLVTTI